MDVKEKKTVKYIVKRKEKDSQGRERSSMLGGRIDHQEHHFIPMYKDIKTSPSGPLLNVLVEEQWLTDIFNLGDGALEIECLG